ncbi:MAG: MgtC/SapB family protein [Faecalicoccus sp.]|nr:MgtC/SapB family protein [Faecalicoccus sp.]
MTFDFDDVTMLIRLLMSIVCGLMIGYERHAHNKGAGYRVHAIICMSSCIMTIVSIYGFEGFDYDASRVAAGIAGGMGFLGAGVIFVRHGNISGLSTASGMWATAGVGMAIGCGLYHVALCSSLLILAVQYLLNDSSTLVKNRVNQNFAIELSSGNDSVIRIRKYLKQKKIPHQVMNVTNLTDDMIRVEIRLSLNKSIDLNEVFNEIAQHDNVRSIYFI